LHIPAQILCELLGLAMGNSSSSRKSKRKEGKGESVKLASDKEPVESQKTQTEQAAKTSEDEGAVVEEVGTLGSEVQPQLDEEQATKGSKDDSDVSDAKIPPQPEKVEKEEEVVSKTKEKIKERRFSEIEHTISTGDLALLYREGQEVPHYAVFVQHSECDPNFPLLLIKGKTKPLPMNKFTPVRHAHPVTAVTRIFYGDYKQVAIRRLKLDKPIECGKAMELMDEVMKIPFTPHELDAITNAESPKERSSIVCTLMVSHLYHLLGMLQGDPSTVTPASLEDHLDLHDPMFLKLPPVKLGPVADDDPPFLAKLV